MSINESDAREKTIWNGVKQKKWVFRFRLKVSIEVRSGFQEVMHSKLQEQSSGRNGS
jgi:hypothetical protein